MKQAGSSQWGSIGANSLSGSNNGQLSQMSQQIDSLLVMIQADLKSSPTATLLLSQGVKATPKNAQWILSNGQTLTTPVPTSSLLYWSLVDSSNNAVTAGAQDYIRASAYLP